MPNGRMKIRKGRLMTFELWLFAMKKLGQTPDAAKLVFDNMPDAEKEELVKEYQASGMSS